LRIIETVVNRGVGEILLGIIGGFVALSDHESYYDSEMDTAVNPPFSHLAAAAFWAISRRRSGVSPFARLSPPWLAPLRLAAAAGLLSGSGGTWRGAAPMAS
jgi:hypothetical protein